MFKVGQEVKVTQVDSGNGFVDPAEGERAVITFTGRVDGDKTMVYVEWVDRPLRHQRNGAFRPQAQMWLEPF